MPCLQVLERGAGLQCGGLRIGARTGHACLQVLERGAGLRCGGLRIGACTGHACLQVLERGAGLRCGGLRIGNYVDGHTHVGQGNTTSIEIWSNYLGWYC